MSVVVSGAVRTVLFPVTVLGYLIWVGASAFRRAGVSRTAQGPLSARWLMHHLGVRPDDAARRLLPALPGVPSLGMRLALGPVLVAHRLSGHVPRALRYPARGTPPTRFEPAARAAFYDAVVERRLGGAGQLVVLGAGFDTRAFRLPTGSRVRVHEVDLPATQAVKRAALQAAGVDAGHVTFVPADLTRDDWGKALRDAGFDASLPALFLWEGVIMYLDPDAVARTFRAVAATAPGSVVAFDYLTRDALESGELYWRFVRLATRWSGEPMTFALDGTPPLAERAAELLAGCGLSLSDHTPLEFATGDGRAWGGFATGTVPG